MAKITEKDGFQLIDSRCLGVKSFNKMEDVHDKIMSVIFKKESVIINFKRIDDKSIEVISDIVINAYTIYQFKINEEMYVCRLKLIDGNKYEDITSEIFTLTDQHELSIYIPDSIYTDYEKSLAGTKPRFTINTNRGYVISQITEPTYIYTQVKYDSLSYSVEQNSYSGAKKNCICLINNSNIIYYYFNDINPNAGDNDKYISRIIVNDMGILNTSHNPNTKRQVVFDGVNDVYCSGIYNYRTLRVCQVGIISEQAQITTMNNVILSPSIIFGSVVDGLYWRFGNWNSSTNDSMYEYGGNLYFGVGREHGLCKLWNV